MIWHIVWFDMGHLDAETREDLEGSLAALDDLDVVEWLRITRDVDNPGITGLISVFRDMEALEAYRVHPEHVPVQTKGRDLGVSVVRLDAPTDDMPPAA